MVKALLIQLRSIGELKRLQKKQLWEEFGQAMEKEYEVASGPLNTSGQKTRPRTSSVEQVLQESVDTYWGGC